MKRGMTMLLGVLGALFAVLLLTGGVILASGALPRDRMKAALQALKNPIAPKVSPESPAAMPKEPALNAGLIEEARQKLENDKAAFDRERRMAEAQLQAERAEIEALKGQVDMKLKVEGGRMGGGVESAAAALPGKAVPAAPSDKGSKAVAQISAKMPAKDVVQLLQQESEEAVVQILKRMDPKQAGKVMTEMLAADPARAQRIEAAMRQGQNP